MINERRDFLKSVSIMTAGIGALSLTPLLTSCEQNEANPTKGSGNNPIVDLNEYTSLQTVGGAEKIKFDGFNDNYPFIVIRLGETRFLVATSKCTHQGCEVVEPSSSKPNIHCLCHGAEFSGTDASVKKRPADNSDIMGLKTFDYSFDTSNMTLEIIL